MKLHIVTGLPNSSGTILCRILSQNPKLAVTGASNLPEHLTNLVFRNKSIKSETTQNTLKLSLKAFCETWHQSANDKTVIDKSRAWLPLTLIIRDLYPDSKTIVTIRDPLCIIGSIEEHSRKFPLSMIEGTNLEERVTDLMSPNGAVGAYMDGIKDLLSRRINDILWIKYEEFIRNPAENIDKIYELLGESKFNHDFNGILTVAQDIVYDGLYFQSPYIEQSKIESQTDRKLIDQIPENLTKLIIEQYSWFYDYFGYKKHFIEFDKSSELSQIPPPPPPPPLQQQQPPLQQQQPPLQQPLYDDIPQRQIDQQYAQWYQQQQYAQWYQQQLLNWQQQQQSSQSELDHPTIDEKLQERAEAWLHKKRASEDI